MSRMTVSVTLSAAGPLAGTRFSGDSQRRLFPAAPGKCSACPLCFCRHQLPHCKRFWATSNSKTLSFNRNFALRKDAEDSFLSNMEDTDEMFDELINKYGKVVFRGNNKKAPSAEVDDDSESLSFAVAMAKVASDVKAADIKVLFVKPLVYWTRFFIIATAFSSPQINAISTKMRDLAEMKYGKVPTGDVKPNTWTILDFGDVVVHIFLPPQRAFYNLEEFYGNATQIELPFDEQPPFRS